MPPPGGDDGGPPTACDERTSDAVSPGSRLCRAVGTAGGTRGMTGVVAVPQARSCQRDVAAAAYRPACETSTGPRAREMSSYVVSYIGPPPQAEEEPEPLRSRQPARRCCAAPGQMIRPDRDSPGIDLPQTTLDSRAVSANRSGQAFMPVTETPEAPRPTGLVAVPDACALAEGGLLTRRAPPCANWYQTRSVRRRGASQ